jgi:cold shock CspA family protein
MTGKINMLSSENASGFIMAENGLRVHFDSSAVLAYDAACLEVGQLVTFDLMNGHDRKAVNVCVHKQNITPLAAEKRRENPSLRYMGFEQTDSIRAYMFERVSPGETTRGYLVTTDLALFVKHHVGIQEGPALCLRLLMEELAAADEAAQPPWRRSLTDEDMLAHVASRPSPKTRPGPRRMRHGSAAASHAH